MKSFKKIIILLFTTFLSFFELLANEKKLEVVTLIESSDSTFLVKLRIRQKLSPNRSGRTTVDAIAPFKNKMN